MKLVLDSNNLCFRANKLQGLTTKQGEPVGAIYGTLNMIQSYLKPSEGGFKNVILDTLKEEGIEETFTEVIACWDYGKSEYRTQLYDDYKGQRVKQKLKKTPEEQEEYQAFLQQMNTLHKVLPSFGVKSLKKKGWEADDLIYTATKLTDEFCIIVSTDRDMLQMVSDRIYVFSPFKEELYTPENFQEKTGVPKEAYLDFRALVGDSSDNIKGVNGIGEKTAQKLINQFKSLDGIKENRQILIQKKRTAEIFKSLDILERNEKLMDLTKVPTDEIEAYVKTTMSIDAEFEESEVKDFLKEKQFVSFLSKFLPWSKPFKQLN